MIRRWVEWISKRQDASADHREGDTLPDFQPIRVAVFGSCVTRDNFNSRFNPGYKDLYNCVLLADHVSMVSLMAPPVEFDPEKLNDLAPRIFNNLTREFNRTFLSELAYAQPEYLIMDFWPDLIFGFADLDGGDVITHNSWSTVKTEFFKGRTVRRLRMDTTRIEFITRWKLAADAFFEFAEAVIPDTKIVVHSARNVQNWADGAGGTQDFGAWPVAMNKYWAEMDDYLTNEHGCKVIEVMAEGQQSFEGHPWGKFPVHYTFDYHQRFLSRFTRIVFEDALAWGQNAAKVMASSS